VLVTLRRDLDEHVPTADSRLQGGDHITAIVAPEAAEAVGLLRRGTTARR
jgi:Trk K+ transport system NAD-binding subunit